MHGDPYEIHDLLTPIADKLQVDANERAIILAIDGLANSLSEQEAIGGDLMRRLIGRQGKQWLRSKPKRSMALHFKPALCAM
jgi:serine/threonine protein phosphatase PrpC